MLSNFSIAFILSKNMAVWVNNNNGNSSHSIMAYVADNGCTGQLTCGSLLSTAVKAAISSLTVGKVTASRYEV